jgi:hypothetical protein
LVIATEALEPEPAPVAESEGDVAGEPVVQVAPLGRMARALRLTGEACAAWADLLEAEEAPAVSSRDAGDRAVR